MADKGFAMNTPKRSANFNSKEETLLVSLVKKYVDILECKRSDTVTHQKKNQCWVNIEKEFNGNIGEIYRNKDVLRKKYENIKKRVKKKYADEKCYSQGTGGGPGKKESFTELDNEVKGILSTRIEGMTSEFDADSKEYTDNSIILPTDMNIEYILEEITNGEELNEHDYRITDAEKDFSKMSSASDNNKPSTSSVTSDIDTIKDWSCYSPKMLKSKKASALTTENRYKNKEDVVLSKKITQWAAAKEAIEEIKKKFLQEEHELKLQIMREKHEELKLLKEKTELEMKLIKEEHQIKMEILELQRNKLKK